MRFLSLAIVLSLAACSSEETPTGPSINQCKARGFICWDNPPLKCIGQYEDVPDPSLKNACGKSVGDGTSDVPCCKLVDDPPDTGAPDTGKPDTGSDASTDASDATSTGDASDAADGG